MTIIDFERTVKTIKTGSEKEVFDRLFNNMRTNVLELIAAHRLPMNVKSISEIDNYVDGNDIGYVCQDEIFNALIERYGGRDEHEGIPDGMHDLLNKLSDKLNFWLH